MNYKILPLIKSHFSIGRSILTLEKPVGNLTTYPSSIFDLLIQNGLDTLVLVEDNMSGLLQAAQQSEASKIKLIFGLRIDVCDDMTKKEESQLVKRAKYIIFAKNTDGYRDLIKIWSLAATEGFYYNACIDFPNLKKLWTNNLQLVIPFYDSFIFMNLLESNIQIPDQELLANAVFLKEDNELPFDDLVAKHVGQYCDGKYNMLAAQSIYYKDQEDFEAYLTFRCLHSKSHSAKRNSLECPNLNHMSSNTFNFNRWLKNNA